VSPSALRGVTFYEPVSVEPIAAPDWRYERVGKIVHGECWHDGSIIESRDLCEHWTAFGARECLRKRNKQREERLRREAS
jgi:hypothetical protein